jgi:5-formyltetrahydrofolate cyclo-ligase
MPGPVPDRSQEEPEGPSKMDERRHALTARDTLPATDRVRMSRAICARAQELPELRAAGVIMSFAAFRSEVDTTPLAEWILAEGKVLCLPRVLAPRLMAAFRVTDLVADLEPGSWGIPEPRDGLPDIAPETMDAVIVPGSVFDLGGRRCGYGGGFYDAYLARTRTGVPRVGLAFGVQVVPLFTCEAHDLPVTAIVTEERVIRPG